MSKIGTPIEEINEVLFVNKRTKIAKFGQLIYSAGHICEIHFMDKTAESYKNLEEILQFYHLGTLPVSYTEIGMFKRLILKIFNIK